MGTGYFTKMFYLKKRSILQAKNEQKNTKEKIDCKHEKITLTKIKKMKVFYASWCILYFLKGIF